jgi:hypothetical protein
MSRRNLLILIIAAVLLIIAAVLVLNPQSGTFRGETNDFAVADTASVTKIFMADKNNRTVLLERKATGNWLLNGEYKARNTGIDMILETIKNLSTKYPVPKKAHDNVIAQMAARSVKVEIYQNVSRISFFGQQWFMHEKRTKTYYVGGSTPDNLGTLMLMEESDIPFVVHILGFRGYVAARYSTLEKDWRDHTVFKKPLRDIRKVIMEIPMDAVSSFEVQNINGDLRLFNPKDQRYEKYDTLKLLNFMSSFADLRYEALLDEIDPHRRDSIIHSPPRNIITLIGSDGDSTVLKAFSKPNDDKRYDLEGKIYVLDLDRAYALVNNDRDFVLIQYFVFDKVLKPLSYFIRQDYDGQVN